MTHKPIRIGTRESQLAVWQAAAVQRLLAQHGHTSELVYIKSEGDTDLKTPLYEIGVQGIFTRSLDIALLNGQVDIAVHSMKDVPTMMAKGIVQAAVLPRASHADILVPGPGFTADRTEAPATIATSSIRRKTQWLHRYPADSIDNLRGNVNTRLAKVQESTWHGAIFAAAGLDRLDLRPEDSILLDWMLPAPAQGAIVVVCREEDTYCADACAGFNDAHTALCAAIERDLLRTLMGGCSTPISALAEIVNDTVILKANVLSVDGGSKIEIEKTAAIADARDLGSEAGAELLANGARQLLHRAV
ncbi:hydroxymethylbilane synthase [Nemorincola caseinilytica]|uniref:Hydroxymethylbilane synthase n=1 Tax=Nemorincola caseinilytica TaxID=2054315 RepID=A0ABP8N901_9BACT